MFVPPTEQEVTARIENEKCRGRRSRHPVVAIHVACGVGCRGRQPLQILTVFMVLSEGARNAPLHGICGYCVVRGPPKAAPTDVSFDHT